MKHGYSDTRLGQIHYAEAGEGNAVVLLHNAPVSGGIYSRLVPLLADQYRVVAPDLPGFGNSDKLPSDFDVSDIAAMTREALDDLGIEKAKFFGVHTGAVLAAEIARQWPEFVESAILVGFPYMNQDERDQRLKWVEDQVNGLPGPLPMFFPEADGSHVHKRWVSAYRFVCWGRGLSAPIEFSAEEIAFANHLVVTTLLSWETLPHLFRAVFLYDADGLLPSVGVPALVMHVTGTHEREVEKRSESVARLMPDARVASLGDSLDDTYDPFVAYWHAEEICSVMKDFWDTLGQS
jgi:pimeloyl-ACP methyl ester carboxylesterase